MTGAQRGFLLLCSHLGDPGRRVLTPARFRFLASRAPALERPVQERDLTEADLKHLGVTGEEARQILTLLSQESLLDSYLRRAEQLGCVPITRACEGYPVSLRHSLGLDAPACLWARGDLSLLHRPMVALVGSRDLYPENAAFAAEAGRQAALQGFTLLSGNARGADRTAQRACLDAGGTVISVVADRLDSHMPEKSVLWLSEDSYDLDFTPQRALSRNRVIHAMPPLTLVAQCRSGMGGTWSGTAQNLRRRWSRVAVLEDGSAAARQLRDLGAQSISVDDLADLTALSSAGQTGLFD